MPTILMTDAGIVNDSTSIKTLEQRQHDYIEKTVYKTPFVNPII